MGSIPTGSSASASSWAACSPSAAGVLRATKYPSVGCPHRPDARCKGVRRRRSGRDRQPAGSAVLGGLIMGVSEAFLASSPASEYKDALAFLLLIAILLVRPAGLLGRNLPEKV